MTVQSTLSFAKKPPGKVSSIETGSWSKSYLLQSWKILTILVTRFRKQCVCQEQHVARLHSGPLLLMDGIKGQTYHLSQLLACISFEWEMIIEGWGLDEFLTRTFSKVGSNEQFPLSSPPAIKNAVFLTLPFSSWMLKDIDFNPVNWHQVHWNAWTSQLNKLVLTAITHP